MACIFSQKTHYVITTPRFLHPIILIFIKIVCTRISKEIWDKVVLPYFWHKNILSFFAVRAFFIKIGNCVSWVNLLTRFKYLFHFAKNFHLHSICQLPLFYVRLIQIKPSKLSKVFCIFVHYSINYIQNG